jgi:hypothetical protein
MATTARISVKMEVNAADFEKHIVSETQHHKAPKRARELFNNGMPGPIAISNHPIFGWAVIESSGQGPYFVWIENETK